MQNLRCGLIVSFFFVLVSDAATLRGGAAASFADGDHALIGRCGKKEVTAPPGDSESVLVLISAPHGGGDDAATAEREVGLASIWQAVDGAADAVYLYILPGMSPPHIPGGMEGCVRVFVQDGRGRGSRLDFQGDDAWPASEWKGYHIVMEETIIYPADYIATSLAAVDGVGRASVVALDGFSWNSAVLLTGLPVESIICPITNGVGDSSDTDVWADVVRLGTSALHAGSLWGVVNDWISSRFLPVVDARGMADVRWSCALHHAGIPRLIVFHPEGLLDDVGGDKPQFWADASFASGLRSISMHFAPWRTVIDSGSSFDTRKVSSEVTSMTGEQVTTTCWLVDAQASNDRAIPAAGVGSNDEEAPTQGPQSGSPQKCIHAGRGSGESNIGNVTVLIPIFHRPRLSFLRDTVCALVGMPVVDRVILILGNDDWIEPAVWDGGGDSVILSAADTTSLSERFQPRREIRTDAVLSLDDDLRPTEEQLLSIVETWQVFRSSIVGPMWHATRHTSCAAWSPPPPPPPPPPPSSSSSSSSSATTFELSSEQGPYKCRRWAYGTGGWAGYYNILLTSFAVFHRGLLPLYWSNSTRAHSMRNFVEGARNCEDVAMNFVAGDATGQAGVAVDVGVILECESSGGISQQAGHYAVRHGCVSDFTRDLYGGDIPLINCTIGSPHRTEHHAFATSADARAEAQSIGGSQGKVSVLEDAWAAWLVS